MCKHWVGAWWVPEGCNVNWCTCDVCGMVIVIDRWPGIRPRFPWLLQYTIAPHMIACRGLPTLRHCHWQCGGVGCRRGCVQAQGRQHR